MILWGSWSGSTTAHSTRPSHLLGRRGLLGGCRGGRLLVGLRGRLVMILWGSWSLGLLGLEVVCRGRHIVVLEPALLHHGRLLVVVKSLATIHLTIHLTGRSSCVLIAHRRRLLLCLLNMHQLGYLK